jgi:hypothetical protein
LATIEVDTRLLRRLMGLELDKERLEELLFNFKGEVEGWGEGQVSVELSSDRPDLLCASGLSRAFKGYLELELGLPPILAPTRLTLRVCLRFGWMAGLRRGPTLTPIMCGFKAG